MIRVFIWVDGGPSSWREITFNDFCVRRRNGNWTGHYFAKLNKHICDASDELIVECSRLEYLAHSREERHSRYLKDWESKHTVLPFSGASRTDSSDEIEIEELLPDDIDVELSVIWREMKEQFSAALRLLPEEDREFILDLYSSEGESTHSYAKKHGLHQTTVMRRKQKIEEFLKNAVFNFKKSGG